MSFIPKTFSQILTTMYNLVVSQSTGITDFNVGAVNRSLMEAAAVEEERLYMQIFEGLSEAIDNSAYNSFGFGRLAPTAAYGDVTFTRTGGYVPDITIAAGTQVAVPGTSKIFTTNVTTTWAGGAAATTKTVGVTCGQTGKLGNIAAGAMTQIITSTTGIASVANPKAYITGTDLETEDERRQRFAAYIVSLPRATRAAIEVGAKTTRILDSNGYITERVAKSKAVETGAGTGTIYVHNGVGTVGGQTTSATLVTACQTVIDGTPTVAGYRGAGITATIAAAIEDDTPVTVILNSLLPGYSLPLVRTTAQQAIKDLIAALNIGDALNVSDIYQAVRNVNGVKDVRVSLPAANVIPVTGHLVVSSSVQVSQFTTPAVAMDVTLA